MRSGTIRRATAALYLVILALLVSTGRGQDIDVVARMALECEPHAQVEGGLVFACRTWDGAFDGHVSVTSPHPLVVPPSGGLPYLDEGVWTFDHLDDGRPELVLHLRGGAAGATAELYDRRAPLDRLPSPCCAADDLAELRPTVTVRARGGWWRADGRPDPRLDIEVDGNVYTIFGGSPKLEEHFTTDGTTDYTVHVRDENGDGRPSYEYRRALVPRDTFQRVFRTGRAIERSAITVNEGGDEAPLRSWIPWPYLGPVTYGFLTNSAPPENYPPVQVDFEEGRITTIGEFVRSRGNDNQWFIYSFDELSRDRLNVLGFESPFAFYDLYESEIGLPELSLRMNYAQPFSASNYRGGYPHPVTGVRYSWIQRQDGAWRSYKVGLVGDHTPDDEIRIDGIRIATFAPYAALPSWVVDQTWLGATFVAEMRPKPAPGSLGEGLHIWDVDVLSDRRFQEHVTGLNRDEVAAVAGTADVPEGLRGEYRLEPGLPAALYASPIDDELHLVGAAGGTWNQGNGSYLSYGNLAGGRYLDTWTLSRRDEVADGEEPRPEVILEQLYQLPGRLLYADRDGLLIKWVEGLVPSTFEVPPPGDEASWSELERRLSSDGSDTPPRDVKSMFDGQAGTVASVPGAALLGASRPASGQYAFLVRLAGDRNAPAGRAHEPLPDVRLVPGMNVLSFAVGEGWSAEPLRPGPVRASLDATSAEHLRATGLTLRLENRGNYERVEPATLWIGDEAVRSWTGLELAPAGPEAAEARERLYWSPPRVGEFPVLLDYGDDRIEVGTIEVTAQAAAPSRPAVVLATFAHAGPFLALFGLASALLLVGVRGSLARAP